MRCARCNKLIESDDNFCWSCGHWTINGYKFLKKDNNRKKIKGYLYKQDKRITFLSIIFLLFIVSFFIMLYIRGQDIFRPIYKIEKQILNYRYGYKISLMKTDNQYTNIEVNSLNDANTEIISDVESQMRKCNNDLEILKIQETLKKQYDIKAINLCDIPLEEAIKIKSTIDKVYNLFPNTKGYLTNISITNSLDNDNYIAYFQPIYQFVNSNKNIEKYNKVNKTQILLNSYYFLNEKILNNKMQDIIRDDYYVDDATWESLIAHEFGHYITFVTLLKSYNLDNITLVTKENEKVVNEIIGKINSGEYAKTIVEEALYNYNIMYQTNINLDEFTKNISNYANVKNKNNDIIFDETIAEAIHNYYIHGNSAQKESLEIVKIIRGRL